MISAEPRRSVARSASSEGSVNQAIKNRTSASKPKQYFSKVRQPSQEEISQINSIQRLSKNKTLRRKLINDYELPVSERESWWRCQIRETPGPLKYKIAGFIKDLNKTQNTYRFKSEGRKHEPMPQIGKGGYLLPGAYGFEDFAQRLKKLQCSYGFKDQEVHNSLIDKTNSNPDLGPFTYETENYLTISSSKEPSKNSFFRSKGKREIFPPKEGPPPGEYEEVPEKPKYEVTSVFKSKSGRFENKKSFQTPGPGHYEPISAWINSKQSEEFNRKGQFFTPSASVKT